eukprot:403373837
MLSQIKFCKQVQKAQQRINLVNFIQCFNQFLGVQYKIDESNGSTKKTLLGAPNSIYGHWERRHDYITTQTENLKKQKVKKENGSLYQCQQRTDSGQEYFEFLPVYVASLNASQPTYTYTSGLCFQKTEFSITYDPSPENFTSVTVDITTSQPKSLFCSDYYFMGTFEIYHIEDFLFSKKSQIVYSNLTDDQKADIKFNGVVVYLFCDGITDELVSLFHTLELFVGGLGTNPWLPIVGSHVPEYMEQANVEFLNESIGWNLQVRPVHEIKLDKSQIKSGDYLMVFRLDGLDEIIMYGTGSHVGHSVMAMWFPDGELYVVESQDGWYWPVHNIQKNKFDDWIQYAKNCDFHVSLLPLKDELRAKFNYTAALQFFNETEGLPFGYHTFLWGWLDTPESNLPPLIPARFAPILFEILNRFIPDTIDIFLVQGLNKRLNTENLTYPEVVTEAAKRGLTIQDLMAIPEQDGWLYHGIEPKDGKSYVCSSYVTALYKAAGLFGNTIINPQEIHDRDLYNMNLFNKTSELPAVCKENDPTLPYCQILGKYRMDIPDHKLSYLEVYDHICEHCPTVAPNFIRPDGC